MSMKALNNKIIRKYFILFISLLFLTLQSCSSVKVISDESFNEISTYEIGQDRSNLTKFSQLVDSLSKGKENRAIAEENILDFLKTDATFESKQFACRELRIIGSKKSVPVLSEMLLEEKTTNIAKYALENIPGKVIDETLIKMLPKASKKVKLGIINILAVRKSELSVSSFGDLLKSKDSDISITAASALGKIANKECARFLRKSLNTSNIPLRNVVLDSYLLCADELVKNNDSIEANKMYSNLYNNNIPLNLKQATLVGLINTSKNKSKEILNRITNEPNELKFILISKIRELPQNINLTNYAKLLPSLQPANQIQLLSVFEDRKDKSVKPFVLEILKSNIKEVRIASIRTLANIGDETDIIRLATVAANQSGDEANYARSALNLLNGAKINNTIVTSIAQSENEIKIELIKTVGTRNIKSALNNIIEYLNLDDKKLKSETLTSIAEISGIEELPILLNIISAQKNNSDRRKVERTISKVLAKFPNQNSSEPLIKTLNSKIDNDSKSSLLRLLGYTGDANALQVLREKIKSNDEQIKIASIKGLSNWASAEPLNDLKQCTISAKNEKVKSTALKGYTKFIAMNNRLTDVEKVDLYKISLQHAKTSNERNVALDGIGHTDCFESLETVKSYINQPDVKQTVDDAINRVSWHLHQNDPERVKGYVQWFLSKIKDERFQIKNNELINVIDRFVTSRDAK